MFQTEENVHILARNGFTNGSNYHEAQAEYTNEAVTEVYKMLHFDNKKESDWDILELGAGTGKFTRGLIKMLPGGTKYLVSEPMPDFYDTLCQVVKPNGSDVSVNIKKFCADSIPLPNKSVSNVIAATCFHWFATDECLQEISRVLVPGGNLVLVWNCKDFKERWMRKIADFYRVERESGPNYYQQNVWRNVLDNFQEFELISEKFFNGPPLEGNTDFIVKHFSTVSNITRTSEKRRNQILGQIQEVLEEQCQVTGNDVINVPHYTHILQCRSKGHLANGK